MTTPSERASAHSRGKVMAAPASASRLAALDLAGLRVSWIDDITVIVEGQYRFNLAASSWCRIDDPNVHGYLVATLINDFKKRISEKPAGGRDSAAISEPTLSPGAAVPAEAVAESPAGDLSPSMAALMERAAWP